MKTKIYWNRNVIGRFTATGEKLTFMQKFYNKRNRAIVFSAKVSVLAWFIVGGMIYGQTHPSKTAYAYVDRDNSDLILGSKIESLKNSVVEGIRSCEKAGYKEADGLIVYDPLVSNPKSTAKKNVPSIGTLQFKQTTVQHYYKILYNKDITLKEAALIALDDAKSGDLAKDIMFKTGAKANDWVNCAAKTDANAQIALIKKLQ